MGKSGILAQFLTTAPIGLEFAVGLFLHSLPPFFGFKG